MHLFSHPPYCIRRTNEKTMKLSNPWVLVALFYFSIGGSDSFGLNREKRTIGVIFRTLFDTFQTDRQPEPVINSFRSQKQLKNYSMKKVPEIERDNLGKNVDDQLGKTADPPVSDEISPISVDNASPNSKLNELIPDISEDQPKFLPINVPSPVDNIITPSITTRPSTLKAQVLLRPALKNTNTDYSGASDFMNKNNNPLGYQAQIYFDSPASQSLPFLSTSPAHNADGIPSTHSDENVMKVVQNHDFGESESDSANNGEPTNEKNEYNSIITNENPSEPLQMDLLSRQNNEAENLKNVNPIQFPNIGQEHEKEKPLFLPNFPSESFKSEPLEHDYKGYGMISPISPNMGINTPPIQGGSINVLPSSFNVVRNDQFKYVPLQWNNGYKHEYNYQPGLYDPVRHHNQVYHSQEEYQQQQQQPYYTRARPHYVQHSQVQHFPTVAGHPSTQLGHNNYHPHHPDHGVLAAYTSHGYQRSSNPHYCTSCRNKY